MDLKINSKMSGYTGRRQRRSSGHISMLEAQRTSTRFGDKCGAYENASTENEV